MVMRLGRQQCPPASSQMATWPYQKLETKQLSDVQDQGVVLVTL